MTPLPRALLLLCLLPLWFFSASARAKEPAKAPPDPFVWLENVDGARSMAWVRAHDAASLAKLQADPRYAGFYQTALALAQDKAAIPVPMRLGGMVYNLWQDADHVQGLWRRTTLADYRRANPHWTSVLDLDALSKAQGKHWVWKGVTCWRPADKRCLIALSDGGEDAVVTREFDLQTKQFVPGGFDLPRAKMVADWLDADTLLVGTDWGAGSMTKSGYPFILKLLHRGQSLSQATPYFKGSANDVGMELAGLIDGQGHHALIVNRALDFFHSDVLLAGKTAPLALPLPQQVTIDGLIHGRLIVTLNQSAGALEAGSLGSLDLGNTKAGLQGIFTPGLRQSVEAAGTTRDQVVAVVNDNVRGRAMVFTPGRSGWQARGLDLPDNATVDLVDSAARDDDVYLTVTGFLHPTALYEADLAAAAPPRVIKSLPARFDAGNDVVDQYEATSKDGTRIPYFIVHPRQMRRDGKNPTLLYAYGGFQISMTPSYSPLLGKLWLEPGHVYVLANIRGGGEFGPAWHDAGLKTHRQRVFDDFASVAQDLIARRITDPAHLGIRGGSNGGLLMGVEFTQHPALFGAVIIEVPLLDMLRYEKIAAGASWVGEYGTVADPVQRAFLARISPYNNLHADVNYPEPFIFTTTKDDRVGPAHARKFAARLEGLHKTFYYYESIEGGHAAGANKREAAREQALEMTYLTEKLIGTAAP
jgi:prolyl oligopeptidase